MNITRPREIFEEEPYYDPSTWQWKVGRQSKTVYEVVWVSKLEKETKVVTKQVKYIDMHLITCDFASHHDHYGT